MPKPHQDPDPSETTASAPAKPRRKRDVVVISSPTVAKSAVLAPKATKRVASPASPPAGRAGGAPRVGDVRVARDASELYDVVPKLANAVRALGNNTVADLIGVARSQPGRWVRGEEGISAANQAAILDLDFVLSLLLRTMPADLAAIWLTSPNAHLGGARPVDVFVLEGQRRVVDAIQAHAEGAFA